MYCFFLKDIYIYEGNLSIEDLDKEKSDLLNKLNCTNGNKILAEKGPF